VVRERELLAELLASSLQSMQASHYASVSWQKQMETRLAKLPEEIAKSMNAETIAAKLSESLRQQFHQTGLPAVAEAMGAQATTLRQASKEFSAALEEFADPRDGAVSRVNDVLRRMKADLQNASEHIRAQMSRLGKELYWTIGVLCLGAMMVGVLGGVLYQRWMDAPVSQSERASAPTVQPSPPSPPTTTKKRPETNTPGRQ
jgi:hypothetical protein